MTKTSRKHKYLGMLPLWILFIFIGAFTAEAATYYVATTGNDGHVCTTAQTITTPKRTIKSGVSCLRPGDKLYIRAGTYAEQLNLSGVGKTGAADQWLTVAGYPGEKVIIRPSGPQNGYGAVRTRGTIGWVRLDNFDVDGVNLGYSEYWHIAYGAHDITLNNIRIYKQHGHGLLIDADNITVQNSDIHDPRTDCVSGRRYYGIYFHNGLNGLLQNNNIHRNAGGGIQVYQDDSMSKRPIRDLKIRSNKIHDNNFCSTSIEIGGIVVSRATTGTEISNTQIYNNLIYKNGSLPGHPAGRCPGIAVRFYIVGTKIWNNTVYGNDGWGITVYSTTVTGTVVQNNIVFANNSGQIANSGTSTILNANSTTDPRFVNATAGDFNLQLSSPAIDKGVPLGLVKVDIRNYPRPKRLGQDIGAYEVQ